MLHRPDCVLPVGRGSASGFSKGTNHSPRCCVASKEVGVGKIIDSSMHRESL